MPRSIIERLTHFRSRYASGGILRPEVRPVSPEEAAELLDNWRDAFYGSMATFENLEQRILFINGVRPSSSATVGDKRLIMNFAEHAKKETPRGTVVKIDMHGRQVLVTYPDKPGAKTKYTVTWGSIEDCGIVTMLNVLKSVTGEYLGDSAKKPTLAKSLGKNCLIPQRRLRFRRNENAKGGAG